MAFKNENYLKITKQLKIMGRVLETKYEKKEDNKYFWRCVWVL
jgi:hypothetical protein